MPDKQLPDIFQIIRITCFEDLMLVGGQEYINYKNGTGYVSPESARDFEKIEARLEADYYRRKQQNARRNQLMAYFENRQQ